MIERLKRTFSILRIFPGFRMPWLTISLVRRGSEGAGTAKRSELRKAPTQMFAVCRLIYQFDSTERSRAEFREQGAIMFRGG